MGTTSSADGYVSRRTHETVQRVAVDVNVNVRDKKLSKTDIAAITKAVVEEFRRIGK